ncbi:MAG: gyrase subunit B protein, partial [Candidatus Uhrbacteria bacterium GW2011_GWF2_44_350]
MGATKKTTEKSDYGAKQITVLEGLEPVRRRPGMYIGSTGPTGLHHLVWEVMDNSFDEAMAGYGNTITLILNPDGSISVEDNGRGIPVDIHPQFKKSALELVLTKLHAGGKFGGGGYKVSGGLHGVGVSVVNALSDYLKAEVKRDGKLWEQEFTRGTPRAKVKSVGSARGTGTTITFKPDPTIFETVEFNFKTIVDHLRQQAYLTKGIHLVILDNRKKGSETSYAFYFEGGVSSYVAHINHNKVQKHPNIFYVSKHSDDTDIDVEVAVQYTEEYHESIFCFANNIYNPEGGMHLVGFRSALTRELNNYARAKGFIKEKDTNLTGDDVREGLTSVISVKLREPQFEGQTKAKLGNPEARTAVEAIFGEAFRIYLEEHPADAEAIIGKCVLSAQARAAARAARETVLRKGVLEGLTLPGKLSDCSSKDPERSEIFIVEGDSAGGSAKQGRDRETQAILPLRGKILNVERARLDKMLVNNEIKSLIIALGTNIGEAFNIQDLRYKRIIIMTDADVDGSHIRTLLLTLFYRHFPELIKQGHIFIAKP